MAHRQRLTRGDARRSVATGSRWTTRTRERSGRGLGRSLLGGSSWRRPSWRPPSSRRPSWPAPSCGGLARGLLRRAAGAPVGQQLGGPLVGELLDRVALRSEALVSPSVTYGPNRPSLTTIGLLRHRVDAQLPQRRRGGRAPAALLGLGEDRRRLVEGDREQLLLGLQRARVGAPLDVRAVAAVLRGDRPRRRAAPSMRGSVSSCSRLVERDGVQRHRLEQRRGPLAVGDVRAVAAGLGGDLAAVGRSVPSSRSPDGADSSSSTLLRGQLVRRQVLGQRRALARPPRRPAAGTGRTGRPGRRRPGRSSNSGIELTPRASISSSRLGDELLQPALRGDAGRVVGGSRPRRRRSRTGAASRRASARRRRWRPGRSRPRR